MSDIFFLLGSYMFWSSLLCLVLDNNSFLNCILYAESVTLSVFFLLCFCFCVDGFLKLMFYMVVFVCEGSLGLSILILVSRSFGSSYFKSMNVVCC